MVYYRKYRPQLISELDLDSVRDKLTSILKTKDIPHAFLFTGTKGLGKTSSARILAKAINCLQKSEGSIEPCNICTTCTSVTNGSHIDVIEIDAASNRGIDEIRDLREKVKFAPSELTKKVYIIDEVHMLTTEAFNALLKTLEEPPSHVVFILATTEFWKLPSTIVSRTFHVQFEKPTAVELTRSLARIVDGEKLLIEEGVLDKVFTLADGAFRDAAKILEELALTAAGEQITLSLLEKSYKTDSIDQEVVALLQALSEKNAKAALLVIDRLTQTGCDMKVVIEKLTEKLREILLMSMGLDKKEQRRAYTFDIASLERLLEYAEEAYKRIKYAVLPALPLELLAVKYCTAEEKQKVQIEVSQKSESAPQTPQLSASSDDAFLRSLIDRVKKDNFSIAGVLRSTKVVHKGDQVEIMTPFKFHGQKLQEKEVKILLETCAGELLGKTVELVVTIQAS